MIRWFCKNPVAANALLLTVFILGFTTWFKLKKEIFPELVIDAVTVTVPYPNASPEEVETGICVPVEDAVGDLEGIKRIKSTASQNSGSVVIEVESGFDVGSLKDRVKSRVDAIDTFPENAERAIVEELVIKNQVMSVALNADADEMALKHMAERVRNDLLDFRAPPPQGLMEKIERLIRGQPRITQVQTSLVRAYEISVEVSEAKLRQYGLTINKVAEALRRDSLDLPSGSLRTSGNEVVMRTVGKKYRGEDLLDIVIASSTDGAEIRVRDIAQVRDAFSDTEIQARFDEKPAMLVNIFRVGNEDTLALAKLVHAFVNQANEKYPEQLKLSVWNDNSVWLKGRMNLLFTDGFQGLILVIISIALFLRPKLSFLIAVSIPASFAVGVWAMPLLGVSINMISLFSFIMVLGIVVDDAIVVGETVYSRIEAGEDPTEAAWRGTEKVGGVVTYGILTTCVAFMPMIGLSGVSGKIWPNIPLVVIPTLLGSLVLTKLVFPAHLAKLKKLKRGAEAGPIARLQHKFGDLLDAFVEKIYQPSLMFLLRWRWASLGGFAAILIVTVAIVLSGRMKSQFFPEVEGDIVSAKLDMVRGISFQRTADAIEKIEKAALALNTESEKRGGGKIIKHILASVGAQPFIAGMREQFNSQGNHLGEVTIELENAENRVISSEELVDIWRQQVGEIPGAQRLIFRSNAAGGGNAIDFLLTSADLTQLEQATTYVKEKLTEYKGVVDIADSNNPGMEEIRLIRLTPMGESLNLTLMEVAAQIRDSFYGSEVQRFQRGREEVKVMVRYTEKERRLLHSLESMKIRTLQGDEIPLTQIAEFTWARGPESIERTDRERSIKISADVEKGSANANEVVELFNKEVLDTLHEKFSSVRYDYEGEQKDQKDSVREIGTRFLFALVVMYILIAIPLKSYVQPLIIMAVIPFGIVGAVLGHMVMGMILSIMTMIGVVALSGVVVNDSLVLVDFINEYKEEGGDEMEAARLAGMRRFRAIFLTSITTFLGLVPMVMATELQAKFLVPMAVALGFGSLFSTGVMLYLVPCIYLAFGDIKTFLTKFRH